MMELKRMTDMLLSRKMLVGYWDSIADTRGCLPDSREGSTVAMVGSTIYVFGGFSRDIYNDTRAYDQGTKTWKLIQYEPGQRVPDKRQNHTMIAYDNKLILFGGSGPYMPSVKMRASYNDLWSFNTTTEQWSYVDAAGEAPKKRLSHAAARLGCIMMTHGGFSTEGK